MQFSSFSSSFLPSLQLHGPLLCTARSVTVSAAETNPFCANKAKERFFGLPNSIVGLALWPSKANLLPISDCGGDEDGSDCVNAL